MLTQLDAIMDAQLLAASYQTPLVQLVHSARQIDQVIASCSALVVPNAKHVYEELFWWPGAMRLLRPPVDVGRVRAEPGACATLVNLSHNKGAVTFVKLAARLEGLPFMGVQGGYDDQVVGPEGFPGTREAPTATGLPANMRIFPPFDVIADAYSHTRVLLVLSHSETYGRVASEVMVSGIPVISTRTPGLEECLGGAGHYVDDRDSDQLDRLVRRAFTPEWDEWRDAALLRSQQLQRQSTRDLRALERELAAIHRDPPRMTL